VNRAPDGLDAGGKLAQVGSRLIDGTARKLADEFFGAFAAKVQAASSAAGTAPQPEAAAPAASSQPAVAPAPQRRGATSWIIAGVVVAVVVVAYLLLR
jgi:type VI protein secretion system component VasF